MANYSTTFCGIVSNLTPEESSWLAEQVEFIRVDIDGNPIPEADIDWEVEHPYMLPRWLAESGPEIDEFFGMDDGDPKIYWEPDFEVVFVDNDMLLQSRKSDPLQAALFVQRFFRHFRLNDVWGCTFSCGSDRLTPDNFGGGAVIVSSSVMQHLDAHSWLSSKKTRWRVDGQPGSQDIDIDEDDLQNGDFD